MLTLMPVYFPQYEQVDFCRENYDIIWLCIYTALSLFTRLYRIGRSNTVVWDEVGRLQT